MSLVIHNVTSAAAQINFEYIDSQHLFGLRREGTYTFSIDDLEYDEGDVLLHAEDAFVALREVYTNRHLVAKIGTDIYKAGIVSNISRESQNTVNSNEAVITIREDIRVPDDGELPFLRQSIPCPHKVESFSEDFTFTREGSDYSYNRTVSLSYKDDISNEFLNKAYMLLKSTYFNSRPTYGFQEDGLSEKGRFNNLFRPRISENYDIINKSITFSENLSMSNVQGSFSKKVTYDISVSESGFKEKSYNVEIVGLKGPTCHEALSGAKQIIDELTTENSSEFGNPISITKGISKDSDKATLGLLFSTDPSKNQETTQTYSVTRNKNRSFLEYVLNVENKKTGKDIHAVFQSLKSDWQAFQSSYESKVTALFSEAQSIFEKSRITNFNPRLPFINETVTYTTDPDYNKTGDILKEKKSVTLSNPVERIFRFVEPKCKERIQRLFKDERGTVGVQNVSIELIKKRGSELHSAEEALALAECPPQGRYVVWPTRKTASVDPFTGITTANIDYNFFIDRTPIIPPSITYRDNDQSGNNFTTYTFNSMIIGAESLRDDVIVWIAARDNANDLNIDSVTIGGETAIEIFGHDINDTTNSNATGFWYAPNVSGTTADVVVNLNQQALRCGVVTYSAKDILSHTPSNTDTHNATSAANYTLNLTATENCIALVGGTHLNGGTTWIGSDFTEDADNTIEFITITAGSGTFAAAGAISAELDPVNGASGAQMGVGIVLK